MKCLECNGNKFTMDEKMGELSCSGCGLIAITDLFEQSVSSFNRKGDLIREPDKVLGSAPSSLVPKWFKSNNAHLENGLRMCNMLLSTLMSRHPLRSRVEECYIDVYRSNVLTNMGLEEKATAVVYYVLKENRTPIPLKELRQEFSCNTRTLNKAIKRINKHYTASRKDGADPTYMLKRITSKITDDLEFASKCQEVLEVFESITKDMDCAKGTVYYASICWVAKNMFLHPIKQKDIARKAKVSISSIKLTTKKLLALIGYENSSQIKGKQINEIRRN